MDDVLPKIAIFQLHQEEKEEHFSNNNNIYCFIFECFELNVNIDLVIDLWVILLFGRRTYFVYEKKN